MKKLKKSFKSSRDGLKIDLKMKIIAIFLIGSIFKINANTAVLSLNDNLLMSNISQQAQIEIKGTVYDEMNQPLPGATVMVKGTAIGTLTSLDGAYKILVPKGSTTLVISYTGYVKQEVLINDRSVIDIKMSQDMSSLDEVVVIGYGSVKKSDLTGSVSSVKASELPLTANASVSHMLAGKASGVLVKQNSAQPGGGVDIVIRGAGSLQAGNQPLYVIDGFPVNNSALEPGSGDRYDYGNRNPLNSINPNDIESIEILKDASSTAIYGARAANGVILITTKRGTKGRTNIEVTVSHSIQNISKYFNMLNATEWMEQSNVIGKELHLIGNNLMPYGPIDPEFEDPFIPKYTQEQIANAGIGTDWWDEVTKQGSIDELNLSLSGGTENTQYMVSVNYFNQEGIVYNSNFERFSGRFNFDQKISEKVKFGLSTTYSNIDNGNIQLGGSEWENSGVLVAALQQSPLITIYDAYGNYNINPNNAVLPNPVSYREIQDNTISKRLLVNSFIEVDLAKGLKGRVNLGLDDKSAERSNYMGQDFLYGAQNGGKATRSLGNSQDYLFNTTLSYSPDFSKDHSLSALVGYEYQKFNGDGFNVSNTQFFTDIFESNNIGAGEGTPSVGSYKFKNELASYFGRLLYDYQKKYLMTFTMRRDGTSNFGENNKWGIFPSAAVAWKISEENFMQNVNTINRLKLRLAYGQTGNSGVGDRAFGYYAPNGKYLFGNNVQVAVGQTQLANPDLKWETTSEFNVGLDVGLFRNRISATFEYFDKTIDDLLANRALPTYNVLPSVSDNIGSTKFSGYEISLNTKNLTGELKWSTDINFTSYKNRWKSRNADVILSPWQSENDPIRAIYGYKSDGVLQIDQTVDHMPNALPGNVIYQDLNGYDVDNNLTGEPDGKIDSADNVLLGSSDPGFFYGVGNTIEYKGFDFNFYFYGMGDRILFNTNRAKYMLDAGRLLRMDHNQMNEVFNIFTAENPSTTTSGLAPNPYASGSDYTLEKADFLRLKNVTLGYTVPKKWSKEVDVRIFADAQNLWTITDYSGVDPETDSLGSYPNQQSFSLGLNIKF